MIVALLERPSGDEGAGRDLFRPFDHQLAQADGCRAWLGRNGQRSSRFGDQEVVVVSESQGGVTAEAICDAYRHDELDCIRLLKPPFAFALFDSVRRRLVAASDIASRAPLAYWIGHQAVVVSSSVLQLLAHPGVGRAVDDLYLAHLLTGFFSAEPGATVVRGVKRLTAGIALVADRRGVDLVRVDRFVPRLLPTRDRSAWTAAFWEEVDGAVDRASAATGSPCLALSGGLDSSALASAIAMRTGPTSPMASFSIVAPGRRADESWAIEAVERAYAGAIRNRRLDCSDAFQLSALDAFALFDDPVMNPLALLPARLRLWQTAQQAGFGTVIDGEGGDELFGMLCGAREALLRHEWRAAWKYLLSKRGERRAIFEGSFALPPLPRRLQRGWAHYRARRTERLPSYLSVRGQSDAMIELATKQFYEAQIEQGFAGQVLRWLSAPPNAGAFATHQHLASALGVALASPLLDRRVIELVLGIPIEWMLTSEYRAFLPEAALGRVPDEIRTRAKDIRLPTDFLRTIVSSPATRQLLRDPHVRERLSGWIRFERVDGILDAIGRGYDPDDNVFWQQIVGLVAFAYWYARAAREYGLR